MSYIRPLGKEYDIFFFFSFYHTGGAERYNAALASATKNKRAILIFTKKSFDDSFLTEYQKSGHRILDISRYTDNKWLFIVNLVFRGIISSYINQQKTKKIVFNAQSNFAYKISPWIAASTLQIEFIHTFASLSYIRHPFLSFYTRTISSSKKTIADHIAYYGQTRVPANYAERFVYILYGIELPVRIKREDYNATNIKILFSGRGSYEKRVHLVAQMAERAVKEGLPVQFEFMGKVRDSIPRHLHQYCIFHGNKSDLSEIFSIYRSCHVLIITSLFEGFPFAVMEAMSQGLAILSTAVGDVPYHVKTGVNGYIINEILDEEKVVAEGVVFIRQVCGDRKQLAAMSQVNQDYGYSHFDISIFNSNYVNFFNSL